MKNLTLSADEELIAAAREAARAQGKSLNDLIRAYLKTLAAAGQAQSAADELDALFEAEPGHSGGARWQREDAYEGRLR
jgi:hypothetical protein